MLWSCLFIFCNINMWVVYTILIIISISVILNIVETRRISTRIDTLVKDTIYTVTPPSELEDTDRIIWSYWHTSRYDDIPLVVKMCVYTWKLHNPDYRICFLSNDTVNLYLDKRIFPKKYHTLSVQHQADCIRIALLERYGGVWIDSTIILNQPLSIEWDGNYDVGGYSADFFTTDPAHPVFENWFISAPKYSPLIREWRREFYNGIDSGDIDACIREMEKTVDLQGIGIGVLKRYLFMHCCFLKVISGPPKYKWKMKSADGPYSYLIKNNWNSIEAVWYLLRTSDEEDEGTIPLIKLRGVERNIITKLVGFMKRGGSFDSLTK